MLVPAGLPVNFTAIFNAPNPAYVAMSVYDDTGATPVLLLSPVLMPQVVGNAFVGKFTPLANKLYVVFMAVYTDGTFTSLDPSFATEEQAVAVIPEYLSPPVQSVQGVMNCGQNMPPGSPFSIFLGDAKTLFLAIVNPYGGGPVDLTNCTEIVVNLPNADGTFAALKLSLSQVAITLPANLGMFSVPISSVVSALLNVGLFQTITATFTIGPTVFTVAFYQGFSVYQVTGA